MGRHRWDLSTVPRGGVRVSAFVLVLTKVASSSRDCTAAHFSHPPAGAQPVLTAQGQLLSSRPDLSRRALESPRPPGTRAQPVRWASLGILWWHPVGSSQGCSKPPTMHSRPSTPENHPTQCRRCRDGSPPWGKEAQEGSGTQTVRLETPGPVAC